MEKAAVVLIFASLCGFGAALQCYTCSVGEQDADRTCVDNPANTSMTNCNKKYCTIIRQEYLDPKDKVASMYRGCEDKPLHMNEIIEDESYRFYYVACQETLCNGGSGKAGSGDSDTSLGDKSTLIIPGVGSGSHIQTIQLENS
ncbi:hypothetical protein Zmor_008041 [Zophobas morio]|uniref:Sodefrin-like factor n=1 Tax=Zophobas morio TaxID=2755281 RepID=A0AA38MQ48_9CUCU|nr:hypothetical protein Zmor_008041 [Zophobas morio]